MTYILKTEELLMCAISIYGITLLNLAIPWWLYLILFFAPDTGMLGYTISPSVGAVTYNLLHHKGIAIAVLVTGLYLGNSYVLLASLLLFAHASFDRIFGFGLKYPASFAHTHLGGLGRDNKQ